ncbi:MAG: hypothetical protein EA426_01400 [Spirochaetaceae bacterium]|nr:MAG: hypothetical protein EA426_01400 [Spirochaetaceae bacterium]
MKRLYGWIAGLHFFVGVGAVFGGLAAVTDPVAPLGISTEALAYGPFADFLIPGLVLLIALGLGNIGTGILAIRKTRFHGIVSGIAGAMLVGWIVIQCVILQTIAALHVVFFLIGAVQGVLALILLFKRNDFPINLIMRRFGRTSPAAQ